MSARRAARHGIGLMAGIALAGPAAAESHYLIVAGLGGQPEYAERFAEYAADVAAAAERSVLDDSTIVSLSGEAATREALEAELARLAERTTEADELTVVLIGHGSYDGRQYKLNLPGPDITGDELGRLLSTVPASSQLVVNATSSSGAILEDWVADNRVLVTATRSGAERNAVRFPEFFAGALSSDEADLNKDGVITAQEAFDFASRKVADSYESEGTLATEHPQLEGEGASAFRLARLEERSAETPEIESLLAEIDALEGQVAALRGRRDEMPADEYLAQLEELLVELARVQERIDAARGDEDAAQDDGAGDEGAGAGAGGAPRLERL